MKTGIIDVGGGMRDIYGAGIMDWCLKNGIRFDYGIGVSAGSANLASYISGQYKRNIPFYTDYSYRKEYMSLRNLIMKGSFIDLDYVYGVLSNSDGESPLDYEAMKASPMEYIIVATDAETGEPHYFSKDDMAKDDYGPIKCSSCVPIVNKPYEFRGRKYYDGGIGDPVPVKKAFEDGCDKCVLILTRPLDQLRTEKKDVRRSRLIARKYPNAARRLAKRASLYNRQLELAVKYRDAGKLLIIAPDNIDNVGMLKKNKAGSMEMYRKGRKDAEAIREFLS